MAILSVPSCRDRLARYVMTLFSTGSNATLSNDPSSSSYRLRKVWIRNAFHEGYLSCHSFTRRDGKTKISDGSVATPYEPLVLLKYAAESDIIQVCPART